MSFLVFRREGKLQSIGRDHVQMLINTLFTRPSKPIRNEVGRLVSLPEPTLILPREKPLPKPKPLTKWEKFAKTKGIQKRKRGRMVWDEERQGWAPRWGANRANDDSKMWAMEAVPGEGPLVAAPNRPDLPALAFLPCLRSRRRLASPQSRCGCMCFSCPRQMPAWTPGPA